MILDQIQNYESYLSINPKLEKAFDFLRSLQPDQMALGRHEIDGDDVYAAVSAYLTVPASEKQMEAHRKYLDIQYLVRGSESIGYAPIDGLAVAKEYDAKSDCALLSCRSDLLIPMHAGTFMILFPQDGHRPGCQLGSVSEVIKVVVKIAVK